MRGFGKCRESYGGPGGTSHNSKQQSTTIKEIDNYNTIFKKLFNNKKSHKRNLKIPKILAQSKYLEKKIKHKTKQ